MRKFMVFGLFAAFIGFAFADDIADRQTVTSLTYVNDELSEKQDIFGVQSGTKVATFTNTAGEITPREVKSDLGNNTNDTALPTVGAVNSGLDTKQDEIGRTIVPNGYTQLEYIESTGTQWINTGVSYTYNDTGTVEIDAQYTTLNFVGANAYLQMTQSGSCLTPSGSVSSGCVSAYERNRVIQTWNENGNFKNSLYYNGNLIKQMTYGNYGSFPYYIFDLGGYNGSKSTGRIYSLNLIKNNTLVRDMVPVRRNSDNAIGMYDTVTETFFTNSGTGTFIAGPAVGGAPGTIVTYTATPGELGEKGIYQDSGTYAEQQNALVDAGTFNAALQNGLDNEFVCANRPDAYDPVTGNCWLWEIHNKTENKSPNLFNVSKIASSPSSGVINNGDGTITATSSASNSNVGCNTLLVRVAPSLEVGKQYVLSFKKTRYGLNFIQLQFRQTNPYSYQRWYNNTSIVITPEMLGSTYVCFGVSAGSHTATIYDIQIEEGTTPTPFQPYNANIYLPENQ